MERVIEVRNLAFRYNTNSPFLFKDLTLDINRGESLCVVGRSGAGKSTLLRLLAKTILPSVGSIKYTYNSNSLFYPGIVFQDPRLLPWRNVRDNIALPLEVMKISAEEKQKRIKLALSQTNLTDLYDRYPHQLSGGQQQRVSLARALVIDAPILLLDEPFSALDLESKEEMSEILNSLIKEGGIGIVLITHDMQDINRFSAQYLNLDLPFLHSSC